jgi:hypothetical protein
MQWPPAGASLPCGEMSKRAAPLPLLCLVPLLALACGSNDDVVFDTPASGAGGDAGASSLPGKGGESGKGGKSGTGDSGSAGIGDSGSAGAGDSGSAGAGNSGSAGAGDSGSAGAGDSGSAGSGDSGSAGAGDSGSAGAGDSGSAGTGDSGSAGSSGGGACVPGAVEACYGGPSGTEGIGACKAGTKTCGADGTFGACSGAVVPASDVCDGVDRDCDGSWTARVPSICPTIQQALDVIAAKQLTAKVLVAPGKYSGDLDFKGARAHVASEGGREVTTLTGTGKGPVVTFASGETDESSLVGFRVEGGTGFVGQKNDGAHGGGIYVEGSSPDLRDLDVTKNRAEGKYGYGGGVYLEDSNATLSGLRIFENVSSYYGGGISISGGAPDLRDLVLVQNTAVWGAAVAVYYSSATVRRSLFAQNKGKIAGSIYLQGKNPLLENVTIVADSAPQGGLVQFGSNTSAIVRNVTITGADDKGVAIENDASPLAQVLFSNVWSAGPSPTKGFGTAPALLEVDPRFVSTTGAPLGWDVHLQTDSLLKDAGDPSLKDADGSRSDIGAFGGL